MIKAISICQTVVSGKSTYNNHVTYSPSIRSVFVIRQAQL